MSKYTPVIGLEIHVELETKSKMFCQCAADWFGRDPNTQTCPVCLGMPGALPVPNKQAIEWTIKIAQALGCRINEISKFDRKHYFYPDLPKGYQISQYDEPIGINGSLKLKTQSSDVKTEDKTFRIRRVHLEEDTGKLTHSGEDTLVDFNRSGVPLVEIVTEPDFDSSDDVKAFLEELHTIITYLDVSNANMQEGSMRLEPNISLRLTGEKELPNYKVEIKNINSFRFVKQAIDFEVERQAELLESGQTPKQETRGFEEKTQSTYSQRSKEGEADYRYFPEPDIPPLRFTPEFIQTIKNSLPELPSAKLKKYIDKFGLKEQDAFILTRDKKLSKYFEDIISEIPATEPQKIANYLINKLGNKLPVNKSAEVIAKEILEVTGLKDKISSALIEQNVVSIINSNKEAVIDYKNGKETILMYLVGQVMRELKGQADAQTVRTELLKKLAKNRVQ